MLSQLVIVVESQEKSDTWHTVEYARRLKKPVACYMEKEDISSQGNEMLVRSN